MPSQAELVGAHCRGDVAVVGHVADDRDGVDVTFGQPLGHVGAGDDTTLVLADALPRRVHASLDLGVQRPALAADGEDWCALRQFVLHDDNGRLLLLRHLECGHDVGERLLARRGRSPAVAPR